ncbi:hypothetical protein [Halomonas stenophila]|uniref:Nucleotidyl transferase AbiEii/AbiGii toxin family protein n=1 Tax=Halomonas stenophila TaxID=795312 RepID=A0A7W5HM57_9GAMM|nr:hypothetical protein [Halomonas stenophila]MBB3231928.1 hypothetical protein [Halomonas stenophila]
MVTKKDIRNNKKNGSWRVLESLAKDIIDDIETKTGGVFKPRLGGGIRLTLDLDHRISHGLDLFINNAQLISTISPRKNDNVDKMVDDYEENTDRIKLNFHAGDIYFIVRWSLLSLPTEKSIHTSLALEPIAEVLSKKLFYRGAAMTPSDLFDWWAIDTLRPDIVPAAKMGDLLKKRCVGINNSLNMLSHSQAAQRYWNEILAPDKPEMNDVINWGRRRLDYYHSKMRYDS